MRDKFVRELKKVKGGKSGDAGPAYSPSWPLFDLLQFLTDTVKHRKLVVVFMVEEYFIIFYLNTEVTQISQHQRLMRRPQRSKRQHWKRQHWKRQQWKRQHRKQRAKTWMTVTLRKGRYIFSQMILYFLYTIE